MSGLSICYIGITIIFISYWYWLRKFKVFSYIRLAGYVLVVYYGLNSGSYPLWVLSLGLFIIDVFLINFKPAFKPGCIIIGYQGIGKSSLSASNMKYIDLESGMFFVGGKRDPNWYQVYCQIAIELAIQGYIVFTSSHLVVREYFVSMPLPERIRIFTCCPSLDLKVQWIDKLKRRYDQSRLDKDYRAYMNAVDRYEENIREIKSCGLPNILLTDMNYKLDKEIDKAVKMYDKLN